MEKAVRGLAIVQRKNLEGQVYDSLREAILSDHFAGGERLTQSELASRLSTSRIPVRDALKRLETDGLVDVDERGVCRVIEFSSEDLEETYALRAMLEPRAGALAVPKLDDEEIQHLHALADQMAVAARAGDQALYVELNKSFHWTLYEASGWRRLVRIMKTLWAGRPPLTPMIVSGQLKRSVSEHRAILAAIDARDAQAVEDRLRRHIQAAGRSLRLQLAPRSSSKGRTLGDQR
jgi:DNA-binding GntR family transcriptional regulator